MNLQLLSFFYYSFAGMFMVFLWTVVFKKVHLQLIDSSGLSEVEKEIRKGRLEERERLGFYVIRMVCISMSICLWIF